MTTDKDGRIILVALSLMDAHMLEVLRRGVRRAYKRPVEIVTRVQNLDYAYDPDRRQYNSMRILPRLRRVKKGPADKLLGIVDVDLYSPGFEFIFGEAQMSAGVGTLSLYRLHAERYGLKPDGKLLEERALKEAVHELGHLYLLGHCADRDCVMHFCTSLRAVDRKKSELCPECR
jgi:archaemetzincin